MSRMDIDNEDYVPETNNINYDSMSEEEEYQPIDYSTYKPKSKTKQHQRAKRSFVAGDNEAVEYQRPSKKRKKMAPPQSTVIQEPDPLSNGITSTTIINSLKKKNQNYDKRATTKILSAKEKNEKNGIKGRALNGKKKRKRKTKNGIDSLSTTLLIQQKTSQNSMHSHIPETVQEKYLKKQYKAIDKLLEKQKKVFPSPKISSFIQRHGARIKMNINIRNKIKTCTNKTTKFCFCDICISHSRF